MAGVQDEALAVAVSRAGGVGALAAAMLDAATLRAQIAAFRRASGGPLNVNFFCHSPAPDDPVGQARWRASLRDHFHAYGIDGSDLPSGGGRRPFDEVMAEVVEDTRPEIVSFHFGLPTEALLQRVKSTGARVLSSATTVDEALWLQARGVDAVIAQGLEAGGHRGMFLSDDISTQVGTWALLPQIVSAVRVPVIAAGGIADARGVAAAQVLGACGVQVGTAYLLCPEARTGALHREMLKRPEATHTALTNVFSGRPARGIVNAFMRERGPMGPDIPPFPTAALALAPLRAAAEATGCVDFTPLWAGQNVSGCREQSAAQTTQELARGFGGG